MNGNVKNTGTKNPGDGERSARLGYTHQDRSSARLIYQAILDRKLQWVGLADRNAGIVDDLVLGTHEGVLAHQFKKTEKPRAVRLKGLLLGAENMIGKLASAFLILKAQFADEEVKIRFLTNNFPSPNDHLVKGQSNSSTSDFLIAWNENTSWSLADWQGSKWKEVINEIQKASGLCKQQFVEFWACFELTIGPSAAPILDPSLGAARLSQTEELARALSALIIDNPEKDRWSRVELLKEVGWPDRFALRFHHQFPIGSYVQHNEETESDLNTAIWENCSGYLGLIGPPGSGKSTLLQRELQDMPQLRVVRYLAFVPGTAQGQGRGEAISFLDDVNAQLAATGFKPLRVKDDTLAARRENFEHLLAQAGQKFEQDNSRIILVVDGLDHIPREEPTEHSLLSVLPTPQSIPDGVLFILGTQQLDLPEIAPAVQQQASQTGRRINVARLSPFAVSAMTEAFELGDEVDASKIFELGGGHPLATRYLLEQLAGAPKEDRRSLLEGAIPFGGDLEAVYESAWRGVDAQSRSGSLHQVLALLAQVEGRIAPEALAKATSDEAVELTLRHVRHLLDLSEDGWRIFHNSFRIFVRRKPVLRFGSPDQRFDRTGVFRTLAKLVDEAPIRSDQSWLRFRYLYLAGDLDDATTLASRTYFVDQYCDGRPANAVRADISDALRALEHKVDATKLFDLLLADDEVNRRASVMESAHSLIDAQLAIGDTRAAAACLSESYQDGKQWLVIDALMSSGHVEASRRIFEEQNPFAFISERAPPFRGSNANKAFPWAQRAIALLSEEQIERRLQNRVVKQASLDADGEEVGEIVSAFSFQVARAMIRSDPALPMSDLVRKWQVNRERQCLLELEGANSAAQTGQTSLAKSLLQVALKSDCLGDLHDSWTMAGAKTAIAISEKAIAIEFLEQCPLEDLGEAERQHQSERLLSASRALLAGVTARACLQVPIPHLELPQNRLWRGIQHHIVAIGTAIGDLRSGKDAMDVPIRSLTESAIKFSATARSALGEDAFAGYGIPAAAEILLNALFDLARLDPQRDLRSLVLIDQLIAEDAAVFRWWHSFRRKFAVGMFNIDRDVQAARSRLNAGLADVQEYNPQEEVEEKAAYAVALGRIGATDAARTEIENLRRSSLGCYLPAKKDGQYELWTSVLSLANLDKPNARADRAKVALRLLDGMGSTEGDDSAVRAGRQILFEACAASPMLTQDAMRWASGTGVFSWDGIVDAGLRGALHRCPELASQLLVAWSHLALPWYSEPHGSTTRLGQFLTDLMSTCGDGSVAALEERAASFIESLARPEAKHRLLKTLEEGARKRGHGNKASTAASRWKPAGGDESSDPEHRSYGHLASLSDISKALASEFSYFDKKGENGEQPNRHITYNLRRAAIRVINETGWQGVSCFVDEFPDVMAHEEVRLAVARRAVAAGQVDEARSILASFDDDEEGGWAWPSNQRRRSFHEIRHLLGEEDCYELARRAFTSDMANARYGVGSTMWDIESIFPLLFKEVPWPQIWDRLSEHLEATRDYRIGNALSENSSIEGELQNLAAMFSWALTLGVPLLNVEAERGASMLLEEGQEDVFVAIVNLLLAMDGEAQMMAVDLLAKTTEFADLSPKFRDKVPVWMGQPDSGVVAAASFLAQDWGVPIKFTEADLSPIYTLDLPSYSSSAGSPASDEHTRGLVLEDIFGWTDPWTDLVEEMADDCGLEVTNLRWRVGQLIQSWGGVASYGHAASKRLEEDLDKISMKLAYRRPQAEVTLRALRHVVEELRSSGRLEIHDWRILLHKLHVYPGPSLMMVPSARPSDLDLPDVPRMLWGDDRDEWAAKVAQDVRAQPRGQNDAVLAYWHSVKVRDIRVTYECERWSFRSSASRGHSSLEERLHSTSRVIRLGAVVPLYDQPDESFVAGFRPHSLHGHPDVLLIFCPRAAQQLGWKQNETSIHEFYSQDGTMMASTVWWRDGLPQSVDHDAQSAEGQYVILSEAGRATFEHRFGAIELSNFAVRRVAAGEGDGKSVKRYAEY
ncbi:hypothetical protein IT881_09515 [Erythrobacter sp. A30-3]|nr:hypothetical protein IT881_09515 [Erythrobacter sp. A30-3]